MKKSIYVLLFICLLTVSCSTKPKMIYDLTYLADKNIWEIEKILGKNYYHVGPYVLSESETIGYTIYENEDALLSIKYSISTTRVFEFMLSNKHSYSKLSDLLITGNVSLHNERYDLEIKESGSLLDRFQTIFVYPKERKLY